MRGLGEIWRRIVFSFQRRRLDRELAEEMQQHLELKAEANIASGMPPEEARYAARQQLGNMTRMAEDSRHNWGLPFLESLLQDVRYGLRGLRKTPGFTTVAALTLALGIGATTAIFSIVHAVVLRPLPYHDVQRILHVWSISQRFPEFQMGQSKPDFDDLKAQADCFDDEVLYTQARFSMPVGEHPEEISGSAVSSGFFNFFQVQPLFGRGFQPGDDELAIRNSVVLSYGLWMRVFGGDPNVVGQSMKLDGRSYAIAGIMPRGFAFPEKSELWVPLAVTGKDRILRTNWRYFTLARMRAGYSLQRVQAELDQISPRIFAHYPKGEPDFRLLATRLQDSSVSDSTRSELGILLGAVGCLLLIGCANVSNLVLSRGVQRRREIALRAALGASRSRIVRQLLIESVLLAFIGGAGGVLLATAGVSAFRAFAPSGFSRLDEVRVEPSIALIAFAASALAGILCGLVPAFSGSKSDANLAMREGAANTGAPHRSRLRTLLAAAEISLALILLTGSGLMIQSFVRLMKVDAGFRMDHLLTAHIDLDAHRYANEEAQRLFTERLLSALRSGPQIAGAALSDNSLLSGNTALLSFDPSELGLTEKSLNMESKAIAPGFLETMGIPVLSGRSFTDYDTKGKPQVVLLNQAAARRLFNGKSALGVRLKFGPEATDIFEVIGVASDTRDIELSKKPRLQVYFSMLQEPGKSINIMLRSSADPSGLARLLQNTVGSLDPNLPVTRISTMDQVIAQSVAQPRFRTWLVSVFAAAGLALTLIGVYGVIAYSVSQRVQEIGIRMALGAQRSAIIRLVLGQGIRLALSGTAIGLLGALAVMRVLQSQLYEIKPGDPLTLAGAAALMLLVTLAASYIPARRATRVDPLVALRHE